MKQYLVKFSPQEPYFFGNEKSFKFPGAENGGQMRSKYFAKSEKTPASTTILGTLRYIFLPVRKTDFSKYTEEDKIKNAAVVGGESFCFGKKGQDFGVIKNISPVFIVNGGDFLVPAPFNHKNSEKKYSPFCEYKSIKTQGGEYLYTDEYNSKEGICSGYMRLSDGRIFDDGDIFLPETRTGKSAGSTDDVLYKRQYMNMKSGFSFGVYVTLADDVCPQDTLVFMGQKKSLFSVSFTKMENTLTKQIARFLRPGEIYCFGDAFVESDIYKDVLFAIIKTRDYRGFTTNYGKVKKDAFLYRTILAGSIFIPKSAADVMKLFENPDAQKIGYNTVVFKSEGNA